MSVLSIQKRILYLIGFDLESSTVSIFNLLFTWINLMLLIVILGPELCYVLANISDLRLATDGLAPLLCSLISVCKLLTIHMTWSKFSALYSSLQQRFFYDLTKSPQYQLTYLWFVQATFLVALSAVGIDTLFYACAWNLVGHFRIVQQRFATVTRHHERGEFTAHFGALVRYHSRIITLVRSLSEAYLPIMLMQFLITSVLLCVIAYQLTLSNQRPVVFVIYVVFLLAICFQCFVYCHGGTTLHTESEALATAIYASQWQEATVRRQRLLLFCLMRAQRPVLIRAVFFSANLPMFSSIISTAGSYIALLQSMSD